VKSSDLDTVIAFLDSEKEPVQQILQFPGLAAGKGRLNVGVFLARLLNDGARHSLSDGRWIGPPE